MGDIPREIKPEKACNSGREYYNNKEADRYSHCAQTQGIQRDLARECLKLMNDFLDISKRPFLLNVGSGSGLCGSVLSETNIEWVGTDISRSMLRNDEASSELIEMDCFSQLPFRDQMFDGAVSVSAVQWVCVASSAENQCLIFMKEMFRILKGNTIFVAQCYPNNQEHIEMLQRAAMAVGFLGNMYTSFPHETKAKKKFLCLYRPKNVGKSVHSIGSHTCCLSWPFDIPCTTSWMLLIPTMLASSGILDKENPLRSRMRSEHFEYSCRMIRLLRRASGICSYGEKTGIAAATTVVLCCSCVDLSPCGDVFSCHVWTDSGIEEARAVFSALVKNLSGEVQHNIHHERVCQMDRNYPISWRELKQFVPNHSSSFYQLKIISEGDHYTIASLTAPKVPLLTVVTFEFKVGLEIQHTKLQQFINETSSTVIGIDICFVENKYSAAMLLYMPNCQRQAQFDHAARLFL